MKNQISNKYPAIVAIIMLLLALLAWPYGYYTLLKWVVCGVSVYYAYTLRNTKVLVSWFWFMVITAVLFNPLIPIYLNNKGLWNIIDVAVAVSLVGFLVWSQDE